jgi:23S rRNA (uracil1939-C5)-methyltransferase
VRRQGQRIVLGYHRRRSRDLVDIAECPVLVPAIAAQFPALRAVAAAMPGREMRLSVLSTPAGLDVAVTGGSAASRPAVVAALGRIALEHRFARIAVDGEVVIARAPPALSHGGVDAVPPPGAFVQAVEAAEQEMARIVMAALGSKPRRIADLFCGIGTFTFALARVARVLAVDGDAAAIAALGAAVRGARGLKPIETRVRDLFREPLSPRELDGFDAAVLDPPRAGARAQAEQLARSKVPTVVAVSCDAGTLARDVRILADGGYAIEGVTPIDQFLFSAEIEAVAVLRRNG